MKKIHLKRLIYCAVATAFLISCKSKQIAYQPTTPSEIAAETAIVETVRNQPDFNTMNIAKMDIGLTLKNRQFNLKGNLKLQKDSLLIFSLQPFLGIEAYRVEFTPTNFTLIDKMNRKYTENNYDFIRYKFGIPIDFFTLQSLVSNQFFNLGDSLKTDLYVVQTNSDTLFVTMNHTDFQQQFRIAGKRQIVAANVLKENMGLYTKYANHAKQGSVFFPQQAEIQLTWKDEKMSLFLTINKIIFNQPLYFPTFNSERYQKVSFSNILP